MFLVDGERSARQRANAPNTLSPTFALSAIAPEPGNTVTTRHSALSKSLSLLELVGIAKCTAVVRTAVCAYGGTIQFIGGVLEYF